MPNALFAFLASLTPLRQVEWLREQPKDILIRIHNLWGFGFTNCNCPARWLPCEQHALPRFQLIARAHDQSGRAVRDLVELTDRQLFPLAWPEFDGRDKCDCPAVCAPCPHVLRPLVSPMSEAACRELLRLTAAAEHDEPPAPIDESPAWEEEAKSVDMAERAEAGFGLYNPGDALQRGRSVVRGLARETIVLRNGAMIRGSVQLEIFDPDKEPPPEVDRHGLPPLTPVPAWLVEEREAWRHRFPDLAAQPEQFPQEAAIPAEVA